MNHGRQQSRAFKEICGLAVAEHAAVQRRWFEQDGRSGSGDLQRLVRRFVAIRPSYKRKRELGSPNHLAILIVPNRGIANQAELAQPRFMPLPSRSKKPKADAR